MIRIIGLLLLYFFAAVFLFVSNMLITKKLSYPNEKRYLQYRLFLVSIVVSVFSANKYSSMAAMLYFDRFLAFSRIKFLTNHFLPLRAPAMIYLALSMIGMCVMYTVVLIAALSLARLCTIRFESYVVYGEKKGIGKFIFLPWKTVNKYYRNDSKRHVARLSSDGRVIGKWLKRMKWATILVWAVELLVIFFSIIFGGLIWNDRLYTVARTFYFLPVAAFFVIEMLQLFFESSDEEQPGDFRTVEIESELIGDVESMMACYLDTFDKEMLLCCEKEVAYEKQEGDEGNDASRTQKNACKNQDVQNAFDIIMNHLKTGNSCVNDDYRDAIISLLNGDAVLVRDGIEGEFTSYYAVYLNYYLSQGSKAIILCSNNDSAVRVKRELECKLKQFRGMDVFWRLSNINKLWTEEVKAEEGNSVIHKANVFICTYDSFMLEDIDVELKKQLQEVRFAVLPDCAYLMSRDEASIRMIMGKLNAIPKLNSFVFVSHVACESLQGKILGYLKNGVHLPLFQINRRVLSSVMVWKQESMYKPQISQGIGDWGSSYIGTSIPLALLALKLSFPFVYIIPHKDEYERYFFENSVPANEALIKAYLEDSRINVRNRISTSAAAAIQNSDSELKDAHNKKVIIIYDETFNFFTAMWKWFKYGGETGTLIHVISPYYMMREYYVANYARLVKNPLNGISNLLPMDTLMKRTKLADILYRLVYNPIRVDELMAESNRNGWDYSDVTKLLLDALTTVRDAAQIHAFSDYFDIREKVFFDDEKKMMIRKVWVRLQNEVLSDEIKSRVKLMRVTLRGKDICTDVPILAGNITNYYLPEQVLFIRGMAYSVDRIVGTELCVKSLQAKMIPDYYPISDFEMKSPIFASISRTTGIVRYRSGEAEVSRIIYGYYSSLAGNDFEQNEFRRTITNLNNLTVTTSHVPFLEVGMRSSGFASDVEANKAALLLCVLLNGAFKTYFPFTYQNLFAIPNQPIPQDLVNKVLENDANCSGAERARVTIPGLRSAPSQDDEFVKIYIIEFSSMEYGMLDVLLQKREDVLSNIYSYLNWYQASNNKQSKNVTEETEHASVIPGRYLHFGTPCIPDFFAVDALRKVLGESLNERDNTELEIPFVLKGSNQKQHEYTCSFCGRKFVFGWFLQDKRYMCSHCQDQQKTQQEEIRDLFIDTKMKMEKDNNIEIRDNIKVRFQSAEAIRKETGEDKQGRVLGFYQPSRHQLSIESKGPAVAIRSTIAHELTHCWQYDSLPMDRLEKTLGKNRKTILIEGHAVFVQIQTMYDTFHETSFAESLEREFDSRTDEYGVGYRLFKEYMKFQYNQYGIVNLFDTMEKLVQEIINGGNPIVWPEEL